jgi:ribosomal protein S18 acetylase RimI-like enzyme
VKRMIQSYMEIQYRFGVDRQDFSRVHSWLTTAYWSVGIDRDHVERGFKHSAVCVGAFDDDPQVGVARVVSDTIRFAYICDVFVDSQYRRRGIAREMVTRLMSHPDLADISTWCLRTSTSHNVYRPMGFDAIHDPERWMFRYVRQNPE